MTNRAPNILIGLALVSTITVAAGLTGTAASASGPAAPLHLVGLGDSIPGAGNCSTCVSYVELYGQLAAEALGRPVDVTNLATNDGLQSPELVERVLTDERHREALASADLVTLNIGLNDLDVVVCGGFSDRACWNDLEAGITANIATILDEVTALRGGAPTAMRVTTAFNPYPGSGIDDNEAWMEFYGREFVRLSWLVCATAIEHGAVCVDLLTVLNGPTYDADPAAYLLPLPDHVHLNQDGHDLVAATIAAAGWTPLD